MADPTANPGIEVSVRAPLDRLDADLARAQRNLEKFDKVSGHKSLENLGSAGERADKTLSELEAQLVSTSRAQEQLEAANAATLRALARQNEEVDNATSSYKENTAALDANAKGVTGLIGETLSLANQLKGIALLAYAAVPAFRQMVNPLIVGGMSLLAKGASLVGPAIAKAGVEAQATSAALTKMGGSAALAAPALMRAGAAIESFGVAASTPAGAIGGITSALGPLMSFLTRIALPITAVVVAWKALNAVISQGADLLERYGNESRRFDPSDMATNLEKLTQLQNDPRMVTAAQAKEAGELSARLAQAHFRLKEFMETQINLNGLGLFFQRIWVNIVELTAKAADNLVVIVTTMFRIASVPVKFGMNVVSGMIGGGGGDGEDPSIAARRNQMGLDALAAERENERQRHLNRIRTLISTGQHTPAGDPEAKLDKFATTVSGRWINTVKDLVDGGKKAEEAANKQKDAWDRATRGIAMHTAAMRADALSIETGVGAQAQLRAEFRLLEAAQQSNRGVTDEQIAAYTQLRGSMSAQQAMQAAGIKLSEKDAATFIRLSEGAAQAAHELEKLKVAHAIKTGRESIFLSEKDIQIAQQLKGIYPDIATALASVEAKQLRLNMTMRENFQFVTGAAQDFTQTLAQGLMDGKSGVDMLIGALDNLKNTLLNSGIKDLFSGDPLTMAIGATKVAAAFVVDMFSDDMKAAQELKKAKDAFAAMSTEVRNFNAAADGFEVSQFVSAIQQITKTGLDLIKAANEAGDVAAVIQLIQSGIRQINNQIDQFIKPRDNSVASQIAQENANAKQLIEEIDALNKQYNLGINRTAEIMEAAAAHIADIQKKAAAEIAKRKQTFTDRLLAATSDNSLEAQLAAFDRQLAQARMDEITAGGEAITELEAAFAAERLNVIRDFNDQAVAETRRAAQEQLEAQTNVARGILDYLNNLQSGPGSTFSPTQALSNAQTAYNNNLMLAQAGNIDAQAKFTSLADNLEKAARAVFGSASGYQAIRDQIIAQGLALPSVAATEDPTLVALREAVIANTAAVGGNTTATGTNTTSTNTLTGTTGTTSTSLNAIITHVNNLSSKIVTAATDIQNMAGKIVSLSTEVQSSATSIQTMAGNVNTAATNIQVMAGNVSTAATNINTLAGRVSTSANDITTLSANLSGPGGASARLMEMANTIGTGGDQQLRNKLISLANDVNNSSSKIITLAGDVNTAASNISTMASNAGSSATNISALAGNASTSATNISTLAGNVNDAAGKISILGTDVNTTSGKVVTMGQQIGSSTSGIGTIVGNTGALVNPISTISQRGFENPSSTQWNVKDMTRDLGKVMVTGNDTIIDHLSWIRAASIAQVEQNVQQAAKGSPGFWPWAQGGIASPGMDIIYGEHHPQGPFFGKVGPGGLAITPGMPPMVPGVGAELPILIAEVRQLRQEQRRGFEGLARAHREDAGMVVGAVQGNAAAITNEQRASRIQQRVGGR